MKDRVFARDLGGGFVSSQVRDAMRRNFDCSAICLCGEQLEAVSLDGLRSKMALHVIDCPAT